MDGIPNITTAANTVNSTIAAFIMTVEKNDTRQSQSRYGETQSIEK